MSNLGNFDDPADEPTDEPTDAFDPADYDELAEAVKATPAGRIQDTLDHFDPFVDGGREPQQATNPFRTGDPVMDAAQGRPMVVLDAPDQTAAEWSEANNYDLTGNYANSKFDAVDDEFVVRCAYVSDVRSEPSKDYTFPVSRVRLIDAHHADDGMRVADRVAVDLLEQLFGAALDRRGGDSEQTSVAALAVEAGIDEEIWSLAEELAKADRVSSDE